MPQLTKIVVQDFRNIGLQELEFSPNLNCLCGNNGQGKTNLLDAIYYLSMTKSAFDNTDKFNYRRGTQSFGISGTFNMGEISERFSIKVEPAEKRLLRGDKPYNRISEHIGVLPVVMVSPSDISLVSETTEGRRKFVNAVLSQMDQEYLADVQKYNKILIQRNVILKGENPSEPYLDILDEQLGALGARIAQKRANFVKELEPQVRNFYAKLSSDAESVGILYKSDACGRDLQTLLKNSRNRDKALHYTTVGVQRDDFVFTMDGEPIRKVGSQGQQKSFLVSLKFAQYEIMKQRYGFPPMLLLDDLFDKLDMTRTANLLKMVSGDDFGQIFITDTNKDRLCGIVNEITPDYRYYQAAEGTFKEIQI